MRLLGANSRFQIRRHICVFRHSSSRYWSPPKCRRVHDCTRKSNSQIMFRWNRSVHRSLLRDALVALIRALILDYCCSVLIGVSGTLLNRLQSVLNATARIVFSARTSDHITPLLRELHWLNITERIQFRLCVIAYRCLHGSAPQYLAETLHLTSDTEACRRLRSGSTPTLFVPATRRSVSAIGHFLWPQPVSLRTVSSYLTFRRELKTFLFNTSFPDN